MSSGDSLFILASWGPAARWVGGPVVWSLRADRPLISASGDLEGEAAGAERVDDQAAARVRGMRLARHTSRLIYGHSRFRASPDAGSARGARALI